MKQDMIVILDLGSHENTVLARAIRALGVYSEIYPHDITVEELKALAERERYHHQRWSKQCNRRCSYRRESGYLRDGHSCNGRRSR